MSFEELKTSLTCCICMEIATLPVHSNCCENAKSMPPACLMCVRSYLDLNKPFRERPYNKKSWGGCGCTLNPRQKSHILYTHTVQLDPIRNLLGPSICPHEGCKAKCDTTAELRRHLKGTATSSDKHGNCQQAMTSCKYCSFFEKRCIVEGEHFEENHNYITCILCNLAVPKMRMKEHYEKHERELSNLKSSLIEQNIILD